VLCPQCEKKTVVMYTWARECVGAVFRDRQCSHCGHRFKTTETVNEVSNIDEEPPAIPDPSG